MSGRVQWRRAWVPFRLRPPVGAIVQLLHRRPIHTLALVYKGDRAAAAVAWTVPPLGMRLPGERTAPIQLELHTVPATALTPLLAAIGPHRLKGVVLRVRSPPRRPPTLGLVCDLTPGHAWVAVAG
jgi:hypothetical protein